MLAGRGQGLAGRKHKIVGRMVYIMGHAMLVGGLWGLLAKNLIAWGDTLTNRWLQCQS